MAPNRLFLIACFALMLLPAAQGAPATAGGSGNGSGPTTKCFYQDVTAVTAVIGAGQIGYCLMGTDDATSATDTNALVGIAMAPGAISGTTTFTWSIVSTTGCTASSITTSSVSNAATAMSTARFTVTLTSVDCSGWLHLVVAVGVTPVTEAIADLPFNVHVPVQDQTVRLCDHSAFAAPCTQATLDTQARQCEASALLSTCVNDSFRIATGLTGTEFFAVLIIAFGCLVYASSRAPWWPMRLAASILMVILAVLLLRFQSSALVVFMAFFLMVLGAVLFMRAALDARDAREEARKKTRRFFE